MTVNTAVKNFWDRWYKADELEKVKIVEELELAEGYKKIRKDKIYNYAISSLVNSFLIDLTECLEMKFTDFLEKQFFRTPPVKDEICHLTYNMWKDLKETILNGEIGNE